MNDMTTKALLETLETYGSDLSRMPSDKAAAVKTLVSQSTEAKALYDEALKLDTSLSDYMFAQISKNEIDCSALEARIMAAAFPQQGEAPEETAQIVPYPAKPAPISKKTEPKAANDNWQSALAASGLLAASLLFGIYFGAMGGVSTVLGSEEEVTMASIPLTGDILDLGAEYNLDVVEVTGN